MNTTAREKFPVNILLPYLGFYAAQAIFGTYLNLYLQDAGYNQTQMGTFTSASTILVLLAQPFWGNVSDRAKSKNKVIVVMLLIGMISILGFYCSLNYWWLLVINCLFCLVYHPIPPLIDNLSLENLEKRGGRFNFGHIRVGGTIGYAIGVLVSGQIMEDRYERMFVMISILFLLSILAMQLVPDVQGYRQKKEKTSWRGLISSKKIFCFIFMNFVFSLGTTVYYSYYPLYFTSIGGDSGSVGILMFATAASEIPFWLIAGRLTERFGYKRMIMISAAVTGVRWILLSMVREPAAAVCINLTHGFCFVTLNFCIVTFINQNVPKELRATGQSLNNMISTILSRGIGGVVIGHLSDLFGVPAMLQFVGAAAFAAVGIFVISYNMIQQKELSRQKEYPAADFH